MTLASDLAELVAVLEVAGVRAYAALDPAPVIAPAVIVSPATLEEGRRVEDGSHLFTATAALDVVAPPDVVVPFTDEVLSHLVNAGVHVTSAGPSQVTYGDSTNPLPAYTLTTSWPATINRKAGTS